MIIYYVDTDFETGASYIECYDRDTNKMKWKNKIHGFNMTAPIVAGSLTYVATIGFVGKLNLENGQYIWKHDDLYEKTRFDSFSRIEIAGEKVNFIARDNGTIEPERVIVDNKTGKVDKIVKGK